MHTLQMPLTLLAWLAAACSMGAWSLAAFIRPRTGDARLGAPKDRLLLAARVGGAVAVLASALHVPAGTLASDTGSSHSWLVAAIAGALSLAVGLVPRFENALYALILQALALVAPVAAVEAVAPRNLDLTGDATMVGVVASTVLAGIWLCSPLLPSRELTEPLVRWRLRFTSVVAAVVLAVCDLTVVACHAADGLGTNAWWHLARCAAAVVIAALAFVGGRATAGAAVVLGLVMQVASAVTQQVPPLGAHAAAAPDVRAFGYSVAAGPTLANLVLQWRVNLFFFCLTVVAVGAYLVLLAMLRRRGEHWPVGRTAAWLIGWTCVLLLTCSGVGRYAPAVFSVHMFMNLGINMLCGMVLALGGFVTLVLRAVPARGRNQPVGLREWLAATMHSRYLAFLYNPIIALVFMTGTYYVFYLTGLYTDSLQSHWLHQMFYLHFLVSGYVFYGLIIGVDQPPHPLPHIGRLGLIIGAMPFHAFFGVILMSKGDVFAQPFLQSLGHPWIAQRGLLHDQWVGGTIAWAGGEFPLVIALVALLTQWSRQDRKEGRRIDRHLDAGTDHSYDAYNDMLAQLAERDRRADANR